MDETMDKKQNKLPLKTLSNALITIPVEYSKQKKPTDESSRDRKHLARLANNEEYFWVIWQNFEKKVYEYCFFRLTNNKYDAEDLCSETMLKAYHKLPRANINTNILAWFFRVAKNIYFDLLRKRNTSSKYSSDVYDDNLNIDCNNCNSQEINMEILGLVKEEMEKLPEKVRSISQDYFFQEKTYRQLSEDLSCTEAYARKQIYKFRRKLLPVYHRHMSNE